MPFQVENQQSIQRANLISMNRSESSQLVDLHIYIIPKQIWKNCQPLDENKIIKHFISAGFVHVAESLTLYELRQYIIDICGEEFFFPKKFIYLRSVNQFLTKVGHDEEKKIKLIDFRPLSTMAPEIYIVEEHVDDNDSSISKEEINYSLRESSISETLINSQIWIKPIDGLSLLYPFFNHCRLPQIPIATRTSSKYSAHFTKPKTPNLLKLCEEQERLCLYQKELARERQEIEKQLKKEKAIFLIRTASRIYRYRRYTKRKQL